MLRFSKWSLVTAALLGGCLACVGGARGQAWKQIGALPAGTDLRCAYFYDTAHGVVGGVNCIYTYRSGVWAQATYPEAPGPIRSLRLLDGVNLYAAGGTTCIWKSTDSGATWQKTSATLVNADDIYLDANGNIQGMNISGTGMMKGTTFAQLNTSACVAACDDFLPEYSSDGGKTWTPSQSFHDADGYCCVADACDNTFYTVRDGFKPNLWRSLDGGKTWKIIYSWPGGNGGDILDGGQDGVLYVESANAILRSTDGGMSFGSIGAPNGVTFNALEDYRMFAFGPTDRSLVVMNNGIVWLWDQEIPSTALVPSILYPSFADSISVIHSCSDLQVPLVINGGHCSLLWNGGGWKIDSLIIDSVSNGPLPISLQIGNIKVQTFPDTILFTTSYLSFGKHKTIAHLYMSNSTGYGRYLDTTLTLSVMVEADNSVPRINAEPSLILAGCNPTVVPIFIQALPCDSVQFTSCTLTLSGPIKYSTNLSFPRTLAAGEADTLLIDFPPQNLNGVYVITAHVTGKYLGSNATFDTTVQIRVTFTSSAGALIASDASVTLDTTSICAEADTTITLTNLGCDSITVTGDATNWLPGWSASDPAFPFSLAPDSSFTVRVHFSPSGPAWSQQNVTYSFEDVGGKSETSSALILNVTAVAASARVALSDTALDLGTFSRCNAAGDTTVSLTNTGCDSLSITSASLSPGTGFALLAGGDTVLAPGQSEEFRIGFADSIAGSYASALHLTTIGAHGGAEVDTTIALNATVIEGSKRAALNTQSINFDTTSICDELDSSVTITNTGCEPDTISALAFANTSFSSPDLEELFIIPPDSQITFPIYTHADTIGHPTINSDTLQFTGNLDAPLPPLILSRGLTYPGSFTLSLASEDSAPAAQIVPVYILRKGTVPASASELDFALTYDDNLLGYVDAVQPDITASAPQMLPNGLTLRSFTMQPASERDTIATLQFKSYLAKHEQTPITLSGQKFMAGGEVSPPCVASLDSNALGTNFTLELACGDGEITKVLEGVPIQIISMQTNSGNLNFTLERGDVRYAACSAQILNVLGTQESERTLSLQSVTHASMEVGTLPAGIYYLRVASGGYVITRRFAIVK